VRRGWLSELYSQDRCRRCAAPTGRARRPGRASGPRCRRPYPPRDRTGIVPHRSDSRNAPPSRLSGTRHRAAPLTLRALRSTMNGALCGPLATRLLASDMDEYEQRPTRAAGGGSAAPFDKRASPLPATSRALGTSTRSAAWPDAVNGVHRRDVGGHDVPTGRSPTQRRYRNARQATVSVARHRLRRG
jgi:hypothetical protein